MALQRLEPMNFYFDNLKYCNPPCSLVDRHSISRDSIVLGRILGEGFFGEVHEGVYKSKVSSTCTGIKYISDLFKVQ